MSATDDMHQQQSGTNEVVHEEEVSMDATDAPMQEDANNNNNINKDSNANDGGKSGSDEERKLFCGGLSFEINDSELREYFGKFGPIQECIVKVDPLTKKSRCFGFITFETREALEASLTAAPHTIKDKTIDTKTARTRPYARKVFCGGLSPDTSEDDIREHFGQFGRIETLEMPMDREKSQRRGFIFVTYESVAGAEAAVQSAKQTIDGKECDVKRATPPRNNVNDWNNNKFGGNYGGYATGAYGGYGSGMYGVRGGDTHYSNRRGGSHQPRAGGAYGNSGGYGSGGGYGYGSSNRSAGYGSNGGGSYGSAYTYGDYRGGSYPADYNTYGGGSYGSTWASGGSRLPSTGGTTGGYGYGGKQAGRIGGGGDRNGSYHPYNH